MSKKQKKIISFARIAALTSLVCMIIYVAAKLKTNPELASYENIVKLVSPNPIMGSCYYQRYSDSYGNFSKKIY